MCDAVACPMVAHRHACAARRHSVAVGNLGPRIRCKVRGRSLLPHRCHVFLVAALTPRRSQMFSDAPGTAVSPQYTAWLTGCVVVKLACRLGGKGARYGRPALTARSKATGAPKTRATKLEHFICNTTIQRLDNCTSLINVGTPSPGGERQLQVASLKQVASHTES